MKQVCGFQKKNPSNEINLYLVRNVNGKRPQSKSSHIIQTEYTSKDEAFKLKTKKSSYDSTNNNEKKKKINHDLSWKRPLSPCAWIWHLHPQTFPLKGEAGKMQVR